jgi:hypothetical protein
VAGRGYAAAGHCLAPLKGSVMGKEARSALLLAASACLLAVMVEWVISELQSDLAQLSSQHRS